MPIAAYDEQPSSLSWVLDEMLTRTSHALLADGRVWLVDPVDAGDGVERATAMGTPAGVLQLLDRHDRDCAAVAARLGVPHLRLPDAIPGSPFEVIPVLNWPRWREIALWWPAERTLVVAEAVGTTPLHTVGTGPAGVHPLLRLLPPRALRGRAPLHLLVGHGAGVHGPGAARALEHAFGRSVRDLPRVLAMLPKLRG